MPLFSALEAGVSSSLALAEKQLKGISGKYPLLPLFSSMFFHSQMLIVTCSLYIMALTGTKLGSCVRPG